MGIGIDAAAKISPEHARMIDDLKDQLLIVFLKELKARGHDLEFTVDQIDATGQDQLYFAIGEDKIFRFELRAKH